MFVDRTPRGVDADSVVVDNRRGARDATRHLLRHGHRRIALLADLASIETASERLKGYESALRSAGITLDPTIVATGLRTSEAGEEALARMFKTSRPPTAVFASRNTLSAGAVRVLRCLGLSHQVAVVGFDDFRWPTWWTHR